MSYTIDMEEFAKKKGLQAAKGPKHGSWVSFLLDEYKPTVGTIGVITEDMITIVRPNHDIYSSTNIIRLYGDEPEKWNHRFENLGLDYKPQGQRHRSRSRSRSRSRNRNRNAPTYERGACIEYEKDIRGHWVTRKGEIVWGYQNQIGDYSVIVEINKKEHDTIEDVGTNNKFYRNFKRCSQSRNRNRTHRRSRNRY